MPAGLATGLSTTARVPGGGVDVLSVFVGDGDCGGDGFAAILGVLAMGFREEGFETAIGANLGGLDAEPTPHSGVATLLAASLFATAFAETNGDFE